MRVFPYGIVVADAALLGFKEWLAQRR